MITNSKLQVIPATSDNANLFLSLQPNSAGLTNTILSATALTYNPFSRTLSLNGIRWPASDGTAGQVLRTDGAGNLTFGFVGLVNFTDTLTLTGVNASVPVSALTATMVGPANIDAAIVAKGTGAILAQVPDGTTAGGNKRGQYAVDLQMIRTGAFQVAGGPQSVIVGGERNTASSTDTVVVGGRNNSASGPYASVLGGENNAASGFWSTTLGRDNEANSSSSLVTGYFSSSRSIQGYHVFGATNSINGFNSRGSIQSGLLLLGTITTDATVTTLVSDPNSPVATNQIALPSNSAYYVRGSVIATVTNGGATKAWTFEVVIKKALTNATTSIVGTSIINITAADAGASTWIIGLTADTTNGALAIRVTGQVANTIRWACRAQTTEVTF
jgi:hypothetical protein